jgi:hypothetical protein
MTSSKATRPRRSRRAAARPDDKEQSERFIKTAIERGADRMLSPADKLLGRLAKQPPKPRRAKGSDK